MKIYIIWNFMMHKKQYEQYFVKSDESLFSHCKRIICITVIQYIIHVFAYFYFSTNVCIYSRIIPAHIQRLKQ